MNSHQNTYENRLKHLRIRAGRTAFKTIRTNGFSVDQVRAVLSAAGGPKWFSIFGLTRYILSGLTRNAGQKIHLLGSSVGAWQMAAGSTSSPGKSMDRLREAYCFHRYSPNPDPEEISHACRRIIETTIGEEADNILKNPSRVLHVITSRGKGWLSKTKTRLLYPGFALTAAGNLVSRNLMDMTVRRTIFSNHFERPFDEDLDLLKTDWIGLTRHNLVDALQASGAIPFVMTGVYGIEGAPEGTYWDGGITDYHLTFPFDLEDGIILQPHFSSEVMPGWFDKKLPWKRRASPDNMANVVLISPSAEYIAGLPKGRISELKDFKRFGHDQEGRMNYWQKITERSQMLADELNELIESGRFPDVVELYN